MSERHPDELDKIPEDYKYLYKTAQGYVIQRTFQDRYGYLHVVAYRPSVNDWMIARSYDPTKGRWYSQGIYCFDSASEATEYLLKGSDGPFTEFSPWKRSDVQFEYDAQYNWNEVDSEWLKKQNHRDPGFDAQPHSVYSQISNPGMSYEEYKRNFKRENQPHRTGDFDIKGGKYAERRPNNSRVRSRMPSLDRNSEYDKEVWEGWTVRDFIEEQQPEMDMIMRGQSFIKPFTTKAEMQKHLNENRPYYKKTIPAETKYFAQRYGLKDEKLDVSPRGSKCTKPYTKPSSITKKAPAKKTVSKARKPAKKVRK